jgi:hypothetical protein
MERATGAANANQCQCEVKKETPRTIRGELAVERGSGVDEPVSGGGGVRPVSTSSAADARPHQRTHELVLRARGFVGAAGPVLSASSPDESGSSVGKRTGPASPSGSEVNPRRAPGRCASVALRQAGSRSNSGEWSARVIYLQRVSKRSAGEKEPAHRSSPSRRTSRGSSNKDASSSTRS